MKKKRIRNVEEEGCIDLVERAVHLLRLTPLSDLLLFYIGAVPFVMGFLFYLSDMASSPFAAERCAGSALGIAVLYIWLKCWHALFCRRLYDRAAHRPSAPLKEAAIARLIYFQLTRSSWAMLMLPVASLILVPFGWVYAYFQNLCMVDIQGQTLEEATQQARKNARPWPKQNHYVISILYGFGYFVFFNLISVLAQLPGLLKSLMGIETEFALSYHWMGNTTFLAAVVALTYLVVEPFIKAAYVLRFNACESITTGDDLLAELKQIPVRRRAAGMVRTALVFLLGFGAMQVRGDDVQSTPEKAIDVEVLDETLDRVMQKREFTWRMPREYAPVEEDQGFWGTFLDSAKESLERFFKQAGETVERFFRWLGNRFSKSEKRKSAFGDFDPAVFKGISVFVLIILGVVLLVLLIKAILNRRNPSVELKEARALPEQVDLEDENIIATLLEEDEWIKMARDLARQGELRKAMRAWFLAGLAALSRMELLSILQSKSNLDYYRELTRRARRRPELCPVFKDNILLFERAWYGLYAATPEDLDALEKNLERMRDDHEA